MTKILLVEDDKSLREIYGVRLLAEGYEIVSAGDGEEALATAIKEKPDLIVSDVMMPKISGFDMLDILRSTPETKDVKIIMMTAPSSEDQRARGESLGANRYLVKSQVGIEDVVRSIHDVLADVPEAPATAEQKFGGPASSTATPNSPAPMPASNPAPATPTPPQTPIAEKPTPAPAAPAPEPAPSAQPPVINMPSAPTPAPQPAPIAPTPPESTAPSPAPTVAPQPAPQPPVEPPAPTQVTPPTPMAPPTPVAPTPSAMPQPTAPFSSPRPGSTPTGSMGEDRVMQPLSDSPADSTPKPDIATLMNQELGNDNPS